MKTLKKLLLTCLFALSVFTCTAQIQPTPFWISDWDLDDALNSSAVSRFSSRITINDEINHTNVQSILITRAYPNGYTITIVVTNRSSVAVTNTP